VSKKIATSKPTQPDGPIEDSSNIIKGKGRFSLAEIDTVTGGVNSAVDNDRAKATLLIRSLKTGMGEPSEMTAGTKPESIKAVDTNLRREDCQ